MSMGHLRRSCRPARAAAALAISFAFPASAAILNVGPGGASAGCEAADIASAVALAAATSAADEIRLVNTQVFTLGAGLHLTDWYPGNHGALTLTGGWDSCTDTSPGTAFHSRIRYTGSAPVVEIDTTAGGSSLVTLNYISLEGSMNRGLLVQGNSTVDLLRFLVQTNAGGGVSVESGASVYLDPLSTVQINGPAVEGGGLRCTGAGTVVVSAATMRNNQASFGGAVYAGSGCEVLLEEGASFVQNIAEGLRAGEGGALFAEAGALVSAFAPVSFQLNSAAGRGGAIVAWGDGTLVLLESPSFLDNEAGGGGGALHATEGAQILIGGGRCGTRFCPAFLTRNRLSAGTGDGLAAMATDGGLIQLKQTYVRDNVMDEGEPHGSVFHASGGGATIRTESVVVVENSGADRIFEAVAGGKIHAAFTTAARNLYVSASGGLREALAIYVTGSTSEARSYTSIYHPTTGFFVGAEVSNYQFDCLIVQTRNGLPANASEVYLVNPSYVDLADGNVRVMDRSPAVDFCDTLFFAPTSVDLDGRPRGHDHPANPNGTPGPFGASIQDAGAYEIWEILADGFEAGNTSRWSASRP